MARLEPARPRGLFQRAVFFVMKRMLGRVPLPYRIIARHPRIFKGQMDMERAYMRSKLVDENVKNLVSLRVAWRIGCPF